MYGRSDAGGTVAVSSLRDARRLISAKISWEGELLFSSGRCNCLSFGSDPNHSCDEFFAWFLSGHELVPYILS